MEIGFIGLGNMGGPMALNLVKHGFPLVVNDIDPAKVVPLRERGAKVEDAAERVAAAVERTICIVETTAQAEHRLSSSRDGSPCLIPSWCISGGPLGLHGPWRSRELRRGEPAEVVLQAPARG